MSESEMAEPWLEDDSPVEPEGWALRPLLLALVGLATGYGVYLIVGRTHFNQPTTLQLTELIALLVGAGLFGFTIERRLWLASLIFALGMAAVAGAVIWWNGNPEMWGGGDGWRLFSLFFAIAIAAPLFQTARDEEALFFPYAQVHDHAWANIVLWFACWGFVLIVMALSWLLSSLFLLIDIHVLSELLQKNWFVFSLIGVSFGAALGILREHDFVVRLLQRVVATVLAVLAPVLAAGLIVFVLALPFTGLAPLWDRDYATVTLLACTAGAMILANVVIGSTREQERRFPVLRYGAMGLALVMLPLAVIAQIAIGLRIGQYGFTPERLWALTFVVIATVFGVAYLVSLLRGRLEWAEKVRPANLILAFAVCAVALVLSTPLISFNAISTRDQVARLESGKVKAEKFDWAALAFDFGKPGRDALLRLSASADPAIKAKAVETAQVKTRWELERPLEPDIDIAVATKQIRALPQGTALSPELTEMLVRERHCGVGDEGGCTVYMLPGGQSALVLGDMCYQKPKGKDLVACDGPSQVWLTHGKWTSSGQTQDPATIEAERAAGESAYKAGQIEVRPVQRRQLFVGGKPDGEVFE